GPATVGESACVGSRSTIFQQEIDAQALIPSGELLMVPSTTASRQPLTTASVAPSPDKADIHPIPSPWDSGDASTEPPSSAPMSKDNPPSHPPSTTVTSAQTVTPSDEAEVLPQEPKTAETSGPAGPKTPVVGQVYISQLLLTLFPERRYFQ
ncbi:MAG: Carboxysome protein CcmN, partial [Cyanobacteriota bacterium]